ncbi:TonB-dependent receptor plug domain-containing protein [Archangium lansingense]|uniref:TonB-dependent receptor plug domain-containing protein n=1 Tax=Archangium lansingense TaxID=2995310 RepID=UPI003B7A539D
MRVNDDLGVGLSGAFIGGGEWWSATLGASGLYSDYNGRRLPRSSPRFETFQSADNLESRKAITRDVSAYGNVRLRKGRVEGELSGRYGELDSIAEFLDFGTLTHENRVALRTVDARARANVTPVERLSLTGSLAFASGGPSKDERLSTGAPQTFPRRKFGYDAWDAVLEGRWRIFTDDSLTLGVDWTRDNEDLIEIFTVDRETGQETRTSAEAGRKLFINTGVYAQGIVHPLDVLGVTANIRYDQHNIYGGSTNYRLGAVWTPSERMTAKLLYGTSFKAPAALQLYSQPLFPGEVIGNPDLRPETARLLEAEVHWRPVSELAFTVDAFLGRVRDKVELVPTGANLQARNIAHQDGMGLEAEAKWFRGRHILSANAAYQHTDTVVSDAFLGEVSNPSERFPRLSAQLRWQYRHLVWGNLATALRFASQRRASVSNIRDNLLLPYELPAYVSLDFAYYKSWGPHTLQLRLDNLLDTRSAEPGFGGVDLPAWGRHAIISYSFEL